MKIVVLATLKIVWGIRDLARRPDVRADSLRRGRDGSYQVGQLVNQSDPQQHACRVEHDVNDREPDRFTRLADRREERG